MNNLIPRFGFINNARKESPWTEVNMGHLLKIPVYFSMFSNLSVTAGISCGPMMVIAALLCKLSMRPYLHISRSHLLGSRYKIDILMNESRGDIKNKD